VTEFMAFPGTLKKKSTRICLPDIEAAGHGDITGELTRWGHLREVCDCVLLLDGGRMLKDRARRGRQLLHRAASGGEQQVHNRAEPTEERVDAKSLRNLSDTRYLHDVCATMTRVHWLHLVDAQFRIEWADA
jgi:hypothetical protein